MAGRGAFRGAKGDHLMVYESNSEKETWELAADMAAKAQPGDIYCLDGDLGAGKTVFAKGFAAGLGITEPVTSPTFNIVKEYDSGRLKLYHFDVYRIEDPDEMYEIGFDEYLGADAVCLIEWSELIEELIPASAVKINIGRCNEKGFDYRIITVS